MERSRSTPAPAEEAPVGRQRRLLRLLLVTGTVGFLALTVWTFPTPGVPPVGEMQAAMAFTPRVIQECEVRSGPYTTSPSCSWTLRLDDGTRLAWPWSSPSGSAAQKTRDMWEKGPVAVRHWRGTVYQIELRNGEVYLDYGSATGWERFRQWAHLLVGLPVAATSLFRLRLEVRDLKATVPDKEAQCLGACLDLVGLVGVVVLAARGTHHWWSGVIGLAAFSIAAPALSEAVRRHDGHADIE